MPEPWRGFPKSDAYSRGGSQLENWPEWRSEGKCDDSCGRRFHSFGAATAKQRPPLLHQSRCRKAFKREERGDRGVSSESPRSPRLNQPACSEPPPGCMVFCANKKAGRRRPAARIQVVVTLSHFTTKTPFMRATWPGNEQMYGYSPGAGALKVTSAVCFGPRILMKAITWSFTDAPM